MNIKQMQRRKSGQGLVEFMLIAPILLFTVMGIVDFGRAMIVYSQGSNALRNAARYAEVWGGAAADNHQYLECGDGEEIKKRMSEVMFADVTTNIIFVKKGYYDQNNDFLDDGVHTITCDEAKANPDALQTGDMMIIQSTGSFKPITPLITHILPNASFQFRAQRTIITNMRIGETTSTTGNGIVNCSFGSTQPEVTVRTSRPSSVPEGGSAIFTFSMCEPSTETVTVAYSVGGTADPSDYNGIASGTVTFMPGQQAVTIPVSIIEDGLQESISETVVVTLTSIQTGSAVIGTPSVATILILNDNPSGLCSQLEMQVAYLSWGALRFKILNVGSQDYDYSSLRMYYYFTSSTGELMGADPSKQTGDNVFLETTTVQDGNTGYLEIRVPGNGVLPGSSNAYVSGSLQLHEGNHYNFGSIENLNDDPSSTGVPTNGIPVLVPHVPLTVNGTVVCGEHPTGSSGGSTSYPTVSISPGSTSVNEGGTANLTLSLSAAYTSDVTVQLSYTGNANSSDYGPPAPPTSVTIPAGQTSVPLNIPIRDDTDQELQETLVVTITGVPTSNADIHYASYYTNIVIPANDTMPTVSISPSTVSVNEGTSTTLTVSLSGAATANVFVNYALTGTASSSDYSPSTTPGSLTIPAGQTSTTLELFISDDTVHEDAETIIVTLTGVTSHNATVGSPSSATITIPANDAPGTVVISANPTSVTEGGTVRFTATLAQAMTQAVSVDYSASGGTATAGTDYPATSGTFTFAVGETSKYVDVVMTDDSAAEGNETFNFVLESPTGLILGSPSSVQVTIVDNDIPSVTLTTGETNVNEGETTQFTVMLSQSSTQEVRVNYEFSGSAALNSDFSTTPELNLSTGTIVFTPGETSKQYSVTITEDAASEGQETFTIALSSPANAVLGTTTSSQFTIAPSDPPTVSITSPGNVNEGTTANFLVSLSQASTQSVTVYWTLSPEGTTTPGTDYNDSQTTGQLTFAAGTTQRTISIPVLLDSDTTANESFVIILSNPTNATLGNDTGRVTIVDVPDSTGPYTATLSVESTNIIEPTGTSSKVRLTVTLNRANTQGQAISVQISAVGGDSSPVELNGNWRDIDPLYSQNVYIQNGQSSGYIDLTVYGDDRDEVSPKSIKVTMASLQVPNGGSGSFGGSNPTILYLIDNDDPPVFTLQPNTSINSNGQRALVVSMSGGTELPVTIPFTVASGSLTGNGVAQPDGTFTPTSGTLTFDRYNDPAWRTINLQTGWADSGTPSRYFHVQLGQPANGTLGTNTTTDVRVCAPGNNNCSYVAP